MSHYKTINKLSHRLQDLVPDFIQDESPEFIAFLEAYFEFLESAILTLETPEELDTVGLEDGGSLIQEEATAKPTPQAVSKFIFEQNSNNENIDAGPFEANEYVIGLTSGALGKVKVVNGLKLYIDSHSTESFAIGETIQGRVSKQKAKVKSFRENPILANNKILDYSDIDRTSDEFLSYFQKDFMPSLDYSVEADKRLIIKHVKELYQRKGTKESLEFLMRVLYKDDAEVRFPIDNTIHVSDSSYSQGRFIQISVTSGQPDSYGKVQQRDPVTGNLVAEAVIENVYFDPTSEINYKLEITENHFGTFTVGASVDCIDRDDDTVVTGTIRGVIQGPIGTESSVYLSHDTSGDDVILYEDDSGVLLEGGSLGSLYSLNDTINFVSAKSDDATKALSQVDGLVNGSVSEVYIETAGSGYSDGDLIIFDDNGTNGSGALGVVQNIGENILLENGTEWGHFTFTATAGQTVFSGKDDNGSGLAFNDQDVRIDVNNVTQTSGFTVSNTVVTFASGLNLNDVVDVYAVQNNLLFEPNTSYEDETYVFTISNNVLYESNEDINIQGSTLVEDALLLEDSLADSYTVISGKDDTGNRLSVNGDNFIVFVNDVQQASSAYTFNQPTNTLTFSSALNNDDVVRIVSYATLDVGEDADIIYDTVASGIRKIKILNPGAGYDTLPVAFPGGYVYLADVTGFLVDEIITGATNSATAKIVFVDTDLNRLVVQRRSNSSGAIDTNAFVVGETITGGTSSTTATIVNHNVTSGEGAVTLTFSDTIGGVGSVRMTEVGNKYDENGILSDDSTFPMLITTPSTNPTLDQTITGSISGATANVITYDATTHVLKVRNLTGNFLENESVTYGSSDSFIIAKFNPMTARGQFVGEAVEDGNFANDYGYLDASGMSIHDSSFYQLRSYVVKVGESINRWRAIVKDLIHPAGHVFFGEVLIKANINAQAFVYDKTFDGAEGNTTRSFIPTLIIGSKVDAAEILFEDETWHEGDGAINNYYPVELEDTLDGKLKTERYLIDADGVTLRDQITGQGYVIGTEIVEDEDNFRARVLEAEAKIRGKHEILVVLDTPASEVNTALVVLDEAGVPTVETDPRTGGAVTEPRTEYGDSSHRNRHLNLFIINSFANASSQVGTRIDQDSGTATTLAIDSGDFDYFDRDNIKRPAREGKVYSFYHSQGERLVTETGDFLAIEDIPNRVRLERDSNESQMIHRFNDDYSQSSEHADNDFAGIILTEDGDFLNFEPATVNELQDYMITERNIELESNYFQFEDGDRIISEADNAFVQEDASENSVNSFVPLGSTLRTLNIITDQQTFDITYYIVDESEDRIIFEDGYGKVVSEDSNPEGLRINDLNSYLPNYFIPEFERRARQRSNIVFSSYVVSGE